MIINGFVVENGEGYIDSNSYVDIETANSYYAVRLYKEWDNLDTEIKQALLISATYFIDSHYDWAGVQKFDDQALAFPRVGIIHPTSKTEIIGIPTAIERAVMEVARKILKKDGDTYTLIDLIPDNDARPIKSIKEKFDVMETNTVYMTATEIGEDYSMFPSIDRLIPKYLLKKKLEDMFPYPIAGYGGVDNGTI